MRKGDILLFVAALGVVACSAPDQEIPVNHGLSSTPVATAPDAPNTLTDEERAQGFRLIFDGATLDGWRGLGRDTVPEGHWVVEDGSIKKVGSGEVPLQADGQPIAGGDLMTVGTFGDFELRFQWKISPGGNSGVKYNVSEQLSTSHPPTHAALGFEYQVLDDDGHADAALETHRAAALYDLIAPGQAKKLRPVGEWNDSRIVFQGNHGEHWLNGDKVLEYELGSEDMRARLEASKYRDIEGFADRRKGHIVLQDHVDAAWFRSLRIREITTP
jgi:hypothetical protein